MDRRTDYMGLYRNISSKLRKRFLKKPNSSEGSDEFGALCNAFLKQYCPSYAGFCTIAKARCEHSLGHSAAEVQCLADAARMFIAAEKQSADLHCTCYQENFTAAINCFEHTVKAAIESREPALAACFCTELGTVLMEFNRPTEARIHFQRAAELQFLNPIECLQTMQKVATCKVREDDMEGALILLTEMEALALERGGVPGTDRPLCVYSDIIIHCELTRVLLLMLLQPTPQRIRPEHAQTLEKYAWQHGSDERNKIVEIMEEDLFIMMQSVVMSCQSNDSQELCCLQSELWPKLNKGQNELMEQIVQQYSNA